MRNLRDDFDCLLCWADSFPARTESLSFRQLAEAFAAECGGAPDQLDHYAWQHLSAGNATTYQEPTS